MSNAPSSRSQRLVAAMIFATVGIIGRAPSCVEARLALPTVGGY